MPQCRQEEILYFHYMAMPQHKNPALGGHEIYNCNRPFHGHNFLALSLSKPCPKEEKKIFSEIHQFYTFYPKITSPWGGASWNLQFLVPSPYIPNLVKIGPGVLEKRMLTETFDARRRTPTHSNSSFEWLRWPKKPQWSFEIISGLVLLYRINN